MLNSNQSLPDRVQASWIQPLGVLLFSAWLFARMGWLGTSLITTRLQAFAVDGAGTYLHLDLSWLLFGAAALCFAKQLDRTSTILCLSLLTLTQAVSYALPNLVRYYRGDALAWDLCFVQSLWRTAHGASMAATWSGDHPLWGDHGSFALFLFAPLTRIGSDPASAVIIVQALLVAAAVPAFYALARALQLDRLSALATTCALAASRALYHAATFDFHPECALPLLLALAWRFHMRKQTGALLVTVLLAASLKDGAAMVGAMTMLWLAWRSRSRLALGLAMAAAAIASFDVLLLPTWSGWPSYMSMNASAEVDLDTAVASTLGRALSQGLLGWSHPFAWVAGAPWILAAGMSPKLAVKGLLFQYGFLWVPLGIIGTMLVLARLGQGRQHRVALALAWAVTAVAINAPVTLALPSLPAARAQFASLREGLNRHVLPEHSVATDACTAPLLMDRMDLRGLCMLDVAELTRGGPERWTEPAPRGLEVDRLVVDRACPAHGGCLQAQLQQAAQRGYRLEHVVGGRWGIFSRPPR